MERERSQPPVRESSQPSNNSNKKPRPKKPIRCFRCGQEGHTSNECFSEQVVTPSVHYSPPRVPHHSATYVDAHCHIDYMCESARVASFGEYKEAHKIPPTCRGIITTYCDSTAIRSSLSQFDDLARNHPEVRHTFGLHPHNSKYWCEQLEAAIVEHVTHPLCVGYGEIGIDVTSDKKGGSSEDEQLPVFLHQLQLASSIVPDKPIIIHYRGAGTTLMELLSVLPSVQKLHLHCWGDPNVDTARRIMQMFPASYFGFTGLVCGKPNMGRLLAELPSDRFVLETDSPYMLPPQLRPPKGHNIVMPPNMPSNIPFIAEAIAAWRNTTIDDVLRCATANTERLYKCKWWQ